MCTLVVTCSLDIAIHCQFDHFRTQSSIISIVATMIKPFEKDVLRSLLCSANMLSMLFVVAHTSRVRVGVHFICVCEYDQFLRFISRDET
jgi:hypothetical protein